MTHLYRARRPVAQRATIAATWLVGSALLAAGVAGCGPSGHTETSGTGSGGTAATTTGSGATGNGGAGAGGGSSSSSSVSSSGTGGMPSFAGQTRVDTGAGTAVKGSADVAVAPDGTIYVSWVSEQGGKRDVFLARSTDGGESFGAAIQIDDAVIEPLVSMARHPYVAADDDRVAVTFNDEGGTVRLYISPAAALSFAPPVIIGTDVNTMFRDFPKPLFLANGSLVVTWQGYPASGARIFASRETVAFASEEASGGAPGVPCECCPLDLVRSDAGGVLVAFRNNDNNKREMWSAVAPMSGAFSSWAAVSTSEGMIAACPMQGPRLAQIGPDSYLAVWSSRGSNDAGSVYISSSTNGGVSWSGGKPLSTFKADEPTIAVGSSGRIFVTGVTGSNSSSMVWSDDGGSAWSDPEALAAPDGALAVPQAENGNGVAALAAVSAAGSVWLMRME